MRSSGSPGSWPPSAAEFRCVPLTLHSHPKTSNLFPEFGGMFHGGKLDLPDQPRAGQSTDRRSLGEGWGQCPRPFPPGLLQPPRGPADPRQHPPLPPGRLDLLADRHPPIRPAAFRKLDALAVLTGPSLPAPGPLPDPGGQLRRARSGKQAQGAAGDPGLGRHGEDRPVLAPRHTEENAVSRSAASD